MANSLAWAFVAVAVVLTVAALQCVQLYILRRWRARVRLPDPVAYTDTPSFYCDREITLRIHTSKPVRIRFSRCGATEFVRAHELDAPASPQSRVMHRWLGFEWKASVVLGPKTLVPGFYRIDIEHQGDSTRKWCMALVVKHIAAQPIVVVASTNTWNAYNEFGGLSNYMDHATPQPLRIIRALMDHFHVRIRIGDRHWLCAVPLPERRPNLRVHCDLSEGSEAISTLVRGESVLIRFLEREHVPYTIISDRDFAYGGGASRARVIVFNTHTEYWSEEMIGRLEEFIHRGISAVFLSGNNIYRKVQFTEAGISVIDSMTPESQVVPLIGSYYDASGYQTFDAYRVTDATHWCFNGLSLQEGSEFGQRSPSRPAASGFETDKIRSGGPGFHVVAVGKNNDGPAFMACRDLPRGGFVFTVGSVAFSQCLDDDSVIQGLVRNLIARGLAP